MKNKLIPVLLCVALAAVAEFGPNFGTLLAALAVFIPAVVVLSLPGGRQS